MSVKDSTGHIFKTTLLFGFVQIFNILVKVVTNKVIAILLGAEGIGIISLFQQSQFLLRSGAGLGISQSAVRDISEAVESNQKERFSRIITVTKRVVYLTSLLGVIITVALSPLLSEWTFGDSSYTISYVFLSLAVGFEILSEGQLAILKGMRQLRALAKSSMIGAVVGLCSSVPLIYLFDTQGIIPSMIIAMASAFIFSNYFVSKVQYQKVKMTNAEVLTESRGMIKMGSALMLITFLMFLAALIIAAYVRSNGGLDVVGYYQAGIVVVTSYFAVVTMALTTDYYPRVSAVHNDNKTLHSMFNTQSMVGLVLLLPLIVIFQLSSELFLSILYTKDFLQTTVFLDYAVLSAVMIFCSNNMDLIFIAKQRPKLYLAYSITLRVTSTIATIILYNYLGLLGLGLGYLFTGLQNIVVMGIIMRLKYRIGFDRQLILLLLLTISLAILAMLVRKMDASMIKYLLSALLIAVSLISTYFIMKRQLGINPIKSIISKFKR